MTSSMVVVAALALVPAAAAGEQDADVRFATFNASLNRSFAGQLIADLSTPTNAQARNAAETIQRVRPDVFLINEFDFDAAGNGAAPVPGQLPLDRAERRHADPLRLPLHRRVEHRDPVRLRPEQQRRHRRPRRRFGFGFFRASSGWPSTRRTRSTRPGSEPSRHFLWKDMPGARLPDDPATTAPADWYSPAELDVFRLSSKSHWDLPIVIGSKVVHFLASHPTPPVFDGPEDRNGTRNFDEIRFWADYITRRERAATSTTTAASTGGLKPGSLFVIAGDQNSRPARRRQHPRRDPAVARASARQHRADSVEPRARCSRTRCRAEST